MNQRIFLSAALAAISLPAQIYTVAANTEPDSLNHTNGNKVVSAKGRLNAFHAKGGQIFYSVSADTRIWTPPVPITTGITPAVAVASDGTIGVAFYDASLTRYLWCKPALNSACTSWSNPVDALTGAEPSLASHLSTMYLATGGSGIGLYTSFSANTTTNGLWLNTVSSLI